MCLKFGLIYILMPRVIPLHEGVSVQKDFWLTKHSKGQIAFHAVFQLFYSNTYPTKLCQRNTTKAQSGLYPTK